MTEFGCVDGDSAASFHGVLDTNDVHNKEVAERLDKWLATVVDGRPIFVSDNPAFDWQWMNDFLWTYLGRNPFGHSARRISDYYAGLCGDFRKTQPWKRLRITPHDHHPVHDAMGNKEAFLRLQIGER